jgi:SPP1 gp7 family putative phage head morphogenesis protein
LTLSELSREIQSPEINTRRARTIARTETIRAANAASVANVNDKGYIVQKKWSATIDRRTRDSHAELDGVIVEKEASWTFEDKDGVTQTLKYPGDPDAPPEQTINCRCTIIWISK